MRKTILITGATGGIGSALAYEYAKSDVRLLLTGRDQHKLAQVAQACEALGAEVLQLVADVADKEHFPTQLAEWDKRYPIDMVIANAGVNAAITSDNKPETLASIHRVLDINVGGVINTLTPLIPTMRTRRSGQIVVMSSLAGYRGLPQCPAYCASKAAVKTYGESLRAWLRPEGIKVNVICPGFVKTAMSDTLKGPKPFILSAEKAAKIIVRDLSKNKPVISFPVALSGLTKLSMILPAALVDTILNKNTTTIG